MPQVRHGKLNRENILTRRPGAGEMQIEGRGNGTPQAFSLLLREKWLLCLFDFWARPNLTGEKRPCAKFGGGSVVGVKAEKKPSHTGELDFKNPKHRKSFRGQEADRGKTRAFERF